MAGIETRFTKNETSQSDADTFGLDAVLSDTRQGEAKQNPHFNAVVSLVGDIDGCVKKACDQIASDSAKTIQRLVDANLPGYVLDSAVRYEDERVQSAMKAVKEMSPGDLAMEMISSVIKGGEYSGLFETVAERISDQTVSKQAPKKKISTSMM